MLTCEKATRLISDGLDRKLGLRERLRLRLHLMICSGCQNFLGQTRMLRQLAQRYAAGRAPTRHAADTQPPNHDDRP